MIFKEQNINDLLNLINQKKINTVLFYGNNLGLCKILMDRVISNVSHNERYILNFEDIKIDELVEYLSIIFESSSLFGGKKILKLFGIKDKFWKDIQNIIEHNKTHIILLSAMSSDVKKIKNNFEKLDIFAAVPCYEDSNQRISQLIHEFISINKLSLKDETIRNLISILSKDRLILCNDLEKIRLFLESDGSENEIYSLIEEDHNVQVSMFVDAFLLQDHKQSFIYLQDCVADGISSIMIIRMMMNHLNILLNIKLKMHNGITKYDAIRENFFHFSRHEYIMKQIDILTENKISLIMKSLLKIEYYSKIFDDKIAISYLKRLLI